MMKLSNTYDAQLYESDIYDMWEKSGVFSPTQKGEPYAIIVPPPNANASLHIGHALNFALMDISARFHRAKGKSVLFLPGADHAGFETQVVYEKHLAKEGKSRFDFSREDLYQQIYDFVQGNKHIFEGQIRQVGASVDWQHFTFTLDNQVIKTAYSTFKKLWDDGLIYRGERLVNYCTLHRTSFADIEVVYEERVSPLYYLKYGPFTLATTRPETKFGDTAVAVHPDDERYKDMIGKTITAEGLNGPFEIRVVGDEYVDPAFGTGAVKITPAHDFNDWEVAKRHNLEAIRVINHDGTLNHRAGEFEGMLVAEARKAVAKALEKKGLLEKIDQNYRNRVGVCYKCGTVIEPMLMDQWFIDMQKLAKPAITAIKKDLITFYPSSKKEQAITYLETVKDWNISRQIAWGIPIPAYQNVDDSDEWIFNEDVTKEFIEKDGKTYKRDNDVFDTWFSSGQWPFITLGYPDSEDFKRFYPTALMETGGDIFYQWVCRMICLGLYVTDDIPFKDVYLHGMVRSEDGRKMSKSLGNVISPREIIDSFGSDALRMGIIAGRSAGYSAAYAPAKMQAARNFCNKLWNIARYIESKEPNKTGGKPVSNADHWIAKKLTDATDTISRFLNEYRFSEAYDTMYHFVWDDLADWYIEASKSEQNIEFLYDIFEQTLIICHPFAPYVSEIIWQTLNESSQDLLASTPWPNKKLTFTPSKAEDFETICDIVAEIRFISTKLGSQMPSLYYRSAPFLDENGELIKKLARLRDVKEVEDGRGLHLTKTTIDCWLDIDDTTAKNFLTKLQSDKNIKEALVRRLKDRLANDSYVSQAPKKLVDETREQLKIETDLLEKLEEEIQRFAGTLK